MNLKPNLGKTAVMKVIYMLQQIKKMDLGYKFEIYTYGPYTAEVTEDIDDLIQGGLIHSSMYDYGSYVGYELQLSKDGSNSLDELSEKDNLSVAEIISFIDGKTTKYLELSSTIVFISELYSKNELPHSKEEITSKVHEIKPHFDIDTINASYCELLEKEYICS
jgi:uncharacterized protein YwgA